MIALASTRVAAMEAIESLLATDRRYVVVFADSIKVFRATELASRYPDRIFDVGIAEQNAVAFAAGLAATGLIPFVATYAGFLTMRACEQMRTFVAYPGLNVKFLGANGGIFGGEREGVTHQFIEDLGIARMMPGMTVVSPVDAAETYAAVKAVASQPGPAYIRIGSGRDPVFHDTPQPFLLGKAAVIDDSGNDLVVFSTGGAILHNVCAAAAMVKEAGLGISIVNVHTLKPLDTQTVISFLRKTGAAITVEDHNVIGGLGSAIAETAGGAYPVPITRLGLQDRFAESGEGWALLEAYGLGPGTIAEAIHATVKLKHQSQT